jgi:hypothetical protein
MDVSRGKLDLSPTSQIVSPAALDQMGSETAAGGDLNGRSSGLRPPEMKPPRIRAGIDAPGDPDPI